MVIPANNNTTTTTHSTTNLFRLSEIAILQTVLKLVFLLLVRLTLLVQKSLRLHLHVGLILNEPSPHPTA